MTLTEQQVREILAPCPFCGERLEVRTSKNPYGRHAQDSECIIGRMAVSIPTDVEDWNRRAADAAVRDAALRWAEARAAFLRLPSGSADASRLLNDLSVAEDNLSQLALKSKASP